MRLALPLAVAIPLLAAAPASAATYEIKGLDSQAWDKPSLTIAAGDTVNWTFAGTSLPHNVVSNSDNWTYRTDAGAPPSPSGTYKFAAPGVYEYHCEIHATTMVGTVTVTGAGGSPPPPAPPGQTTYPNDSHPPATVETGGLDRRKPRLSAVRVRTAGSKVRVRFRVSERSRVLVRVVRHGRTVTKKQVTTSGRRTVTTRSLRAGSYRVDILARDPAGNRSKLKHKRLTIA
jgi:plastocyanin